MKLTLQTSTQTRSFRITYPHHHHHHNPPSNCTTQEVKRRHSSHSSRKNGSHPALVDPKRSCFWASWGEGAYPERRIPTPTRKKDERVRPFMGCVIDTFWGHPPSKKLRQRVAVQGKSGKRAGRQAGRQAGRLSDAGLSQLYALTALPCAS